jgi:hypothetical protein
MPIDEFVPVAKRRRSVLRKRHYGGTQTTYNPVNAPIGRWRPLTLRGERCHCPMHGRNGGTRCAQSHALDQRHEFRRELALSRIGAFGSYQPHQPGDAVAGQPPLHGAERDTGIPGSLRQRNILVEVGSKHRKARHGLLALCLGAGGQRRCNVLLLIHENHSIARLEVSVRGSSNGQVSTHVDPQIKPVCGISH